MPIKNFKLLMESLRLPIFDTVEQLSLLTGLSGSLLYCLSQHQNRYYVKHEVPKKDGKMRTVYAPSYSMHIVQRWILKNILDKVSPSDYAMAFRKGTAYGCKANAMHHIETFYGIAIDLKDFFPSIEAKRVYRVFSNIGYDKLAATILTNLCTLDGHLLQGGACSPALSNLVCLSLDARLSGYCEKRRVRYSRYADDMFFSCDNQDTLKKIVPVIRDIIVSENFTINEKKVHYYTPSNRKCITGVVIASPNKLNKAPMLKADRKIKKRIRTEIFKAICSGDYSYNQHILGEISYISQIEKDYRSKISDYLEKTARKFDIYPELVDAFNKNKLWKEIHDASNSPITKKLLSNEPLSTDEIKILGTSFIHRVRYLEGNNIDDICEYKGWPDSLLKSLME